MGDAGITGSQLRPYTNLWKFTQQKPGGVAEQGGTWSDSLESTVYNGQPAMKKDADRELREKGNQIDLCQRFRS